MLDRPTIEDTNEVDRFPVHLLTASASTSPADSCDCPVAVFEQIFYRDFLAFEPAQLYRTT